MESAEGRRLHGLAAQARERHEIPEAIGLVFQSFRKYIADRDFAGGAEVLLDGSIGLRNIGELEDIKEYLIVSKKFIEAGIEIAQLHNDEQTLAVAHFNQGKILEALDQLPEAIEAYQKAYDGISSNPPDSHAKRPAIVANYKVALYIAKVRSGDQSALDNALESTEELKNAEEISDYNKHVWVSGAYLDLAKALKDSDRPKAEDYLKQAKDIIDSDPELEIRKSQWEKLAKEFS